MKVTTIIAFILVIVGAINWLLVGLFSLDVVSMIFGVSSIISRTVFSLVGLCGLWLVFINFLYKPFNRVQ